MSDEQALGVIRREVLGRVQTAISLLAMTMISVGRRDYDEAYRAVSRCYRILEKARRSLYLLGLLSDDPP